jgi:hypothetical protein
MRRLTIGLLGSALALGFVACADDPEEPNAFQTQGNDDEAGSETEQLPDQLEGVDDDIDSTTTTDDGNDDTTTTTTDDGNDDTTTTTTTGGDGECGNGVIDDGEQCDGGNLGGFSCTDLGYSGGTLACDPVTCTYDASGCTTDNSTTQGSTSG